MGWHAIKMNQSKNQIIMKLFTSKKKKKKKKKKKIKLA